MYYKFALCIGGVRYMVGIAKKIIEEEFMNDDSKIEYEDGNRYNIEIIFRANQNSYISENNCGCEKITNRLKEVYPEYIMDIYFFCFTCNSCYTNNICDNCEIKNCDGCCSWLHLF